MFVDIAFIFSRWNNETDRKMWPVNVVLFLAAHMWPVVSEPSVVVFVLERGEPLCTVACLVQQFLHTLLSYWCDNRFSWTFVVDRKSVLSQGHTAQQLQEQHTARLWLRTNEVNVIYHIPVVQSASLRGMQSTGLCIYQALPNCGSLFGLFQYRD